MVNWLIDADMFDGYRDELLAAIHAQGHDAKLIHAPSPPFRWDDVGCSYRETFPEDACVISHGDIELVTRIHTEKRWTPGAFCSVEQFYWSNYACWYGEHLLNRDYIMLPFGELDRCSEFLFDTVGLDQRIFVRPDSPLKLFTGQVVTRETFSADLEFMSFYEFPVSSLVVVSSPKAILNEWRFVVANGNVVAGCEYKHDDRLDYRPEFDGAAFELAKAIAAIDTAPDPVWIMDICKTSNNSYHLLEIGGFSFSDLYACKMTDVVAAVSEAAGGCVAKEDGQSLAWFGGVVWGEVVVMPKQPHCAREPRAFALFALLGALVLAATILIKPPSGERAAHAAALEMLKHLQDGADLTGQGAVKQRRDEFGQIRELRLYFKEDGWRVGNDFLETLSSLTSLEKLIVFHSDIDDDGLRAVRRMPQLRELTINHAPITDRGLRHLRGLGSLRRIQFRGTKITREKSVELHETIPQCEILDSWCCGCMTIPASNAESRFN